MPIKSFGYYSAIIVPMNYILIIFMLPPMLIFYEKYCSRICCKKPKAERQRRYSYDGAIEPQAQSISQLFFGNIWSTFVRKVRWFIIIIAFAWVIFASFKIQDIKPLSKQESFLPYDHPEMVAMDQLTKYFIINDDKQLSVDIYFGVKSIDKTNTSLWKMEDIGEVIFDDNFDISDVATQKAIRDFCTNLTQQEFAIKDSVDCVIDRFYTWVEASG